mgnify:CR=1 FL=1
MRAFARVGITALVDEATGYQYERENDELQKILKAYISEELLPWQKRFPDIFYNCICHCGILCQPTVHRFLHHQKSCLYQILVKIPVIFSVCTGNNRKIKKYHYSHISITHLSCKILSVIHHYHSMHQIHSWYKF